MGLPGHGSAAPQALERLWSLQLVVGGQGTLGQQLQPQLRVKRAPAAGGTGATFIYYYQAGKERGEKEAGT